MIVVITVTSKNTCHTSTPHSAKLSANPGQRMIIPTEFYHSKAEQNILWANTCWSMLIWIVTRVPLRQVSLFRNVNTSWILIFNLSLLTDLPAHVDVSELQGHFCMLMPDLSILSHLHLLPFCLFVFLMCPPHHSLFLPDEFHSLHWNSFSSIWMFLASGNWQKKESF